MNPTIPFRFIERVMIQHAHPVKLTADITGVLVGWYFLWIHHLVFALIAIFGASVIGTLLVWNQDIHQLAATPLGRWMRGQAEPLNLVVRSIGFLLLCLGVWFHAVVYMPLGIALLIAARYLGNTTWRTKTRTN